MKPKFVMHTRNGNTFDPVEVKISKIDINDIAHSLANMSRYAGHTRHFYSVAEHSILAYSIAHKLCPDDLDVQWAALLHDATEAYVVDLPTPIKILLPKFNEIESKVEDLIAAEFNIDWSNSVKNMVKRIDVEALATEVPELFDDVGVWAAIAGKDRHLELLDPKFPLKSGEAKHLFIQVYNQLKRRRDRENLRL